MDIIFLFLDGTKKARRLERRGNKILKIELTNKKQKTPKTHKKHQKTKQKQTKNKPTKIKFAEIIV